MTFKSLDIVIGLALTDPSTGGMTYKQLGERLHLSPSVVHLSLRRANEGGWLVGRGIDYDAFSKILEATPYLFPGVRGPAVRGIPTSVAAKPLLGKFIVNGLPPVWPCATGTTRGYAIEPLCAPVAIAAAAHNQWLYELLVLLDAWREGAAREAQEARSMLIERIAGGKRD